MPHGTSGGAPFWDGSKRTSDSGIDSEIKRLEQKKDKTLAEWDAQIEAKMERNRRQLRRNHGRGFGCDY
jgi:hypothetical protein